MKMIRHRRGINFLDQWVEFFFFVLLIIGFAVSVSIGSAFFSYVVVFLFGFMAGRFLNYRKRMLPFYLVTLGLLVGYIIGSRYGNWRITLFCFIVGAAISWFLHNKKILK
ncbi:MAG: hypothetical protein R6U32_05810 [Candidatus Woesearchaeota archaeon]